MPRPAALERCETERSAARGAPRTIGWRWVWLLALSLLAGCDLDLAQPMLVTSWTMLIDGAAPVQITLPGHPDLPAHDLDYALRTEVKLPDSMRDQQLTLAFVRLPAIARLEVDGHAVTQINPAVGSSYRVSGAQRWSIPSELTHSPTLRFDLFLKHRSTETGWFDATPRLSATAQGDAFFVAVNTFNEATALFGMAVVVIVGFAFLLVWLSDRTRRAHGWFTLEALGGFAFPAFASGVTQPIFGTADTMVLAAQITLAAACATCFVYVQYGLRFPFRNVLLPWVAFAIYALVVGGPYRTAHWVAPISVVAISVSAMFHGWLCFQLATTKPRPRNVFWVTLAWPIAGLLGSVDCATWLGLGRYFEGVQLGSAAICVVMLMRISSLSRDHLRSLQDAESLSNELAARLAKQEDQNREIEALNTELRRQIAARSTQLADALARIGARHGGLVTLEPDSTVAGRYRVVRAIGAGGMGAVYEVIRLLDNDHFALKVLHARSDAMALARFAREAQVAAQIDNEHVVSIIDLDIDEDGFLFLVMELVEGVPLSDLRDRFGDFPFALTVLTQIADGLAAIHDAGVVHRDLKPANVLVREDSNILVKIADFGIAMLGVTDFDDEPTMNDRAANLSAPPNVERPTEGAIPIKRSQPPPASIAGDLVPRSMPWSERLREELTAKVNSSPRRVVQDAPPTPTDVDTDTEGDAANGEREPSRAEIVRRSVTPLTHTGVIMGTPLYMAPEALRGAKNTRPSADVYALGVIAWLMITRDVPFPERRSGETVPRDPPPIGVASGELPREASDAIDASLQIDPSKRPTAREFAEAMRAASRVLTPRGRAESSENAGVGLARSNGGFAVVRVSIDRIRTG